MDLRPQAGGSALTFELLGALVMIGAASLSALAAMWRAPPKDDSRRRAGETSSENRKTQDT